MDSILPPSQEDDHEEVVAADAVKKINLHDENDGVGADDIKKSELHPEDDDNNNSNNNNNDNDNEILSSKDSGEEELSDVNNEDDSTVTAVEDFEDDKDADSDADVPNTEAAEQLLIDATNQKEDGNQHFKVNELDKAAISYRRGVNCIKKLNKNNTGNEQVQGLLVTLQTNFSMVRFKQRKYRVSAELAGRALLIDRTNVKALYRRAVAYRQMGEFESARIDLRTALQKEPNNMACKKELISMKKELDQSKENQKKALAKAFSSGTGSSFLYTDKEEEDKRKQERIRQKKIEEQELHKKRKAKWEDECVKRMTNNEKVESYEEWDERLKKEDEAKKKIEETKRKTEENKKKDAERKMRNAMKKENNNNHQNKNNKNDNTENDEDDELTEKEIAMMRGYKKTADGRTTSYFTREISDAEKEQLGMNIAPKLLSSSVPQNSMSSSSSLLSAASNIDLNHPATKTTIVPSTSGTSQQQTTPVSSSSSSSSLLQQPGPSAWNQAQTWEEKDTTEWCKNKLRHRLENTKVINIDNKYDAIITSLEEITGDASVALAGGKKRYIFDFHVTLKYEISMKQVDDNKNQNNKNNNNNNNSSNDDSTDKNIVGCGIIRIPDISSVSHDEIEILYDAWLIHRPPPSSSIAVVGKDDVTNVRNVFLTNQIRENVQLWVQDFNNQY